METTGEQRKMTRDDYGGMYHFTCECGGSMATNAQILQGAIFSGKYFRCPNYLYQTCNKSYSAQYLKDNAHWTKPNIPAHL